MSDNNSISRTWHYRILWIVASLSLLVSAILLIGLIDFRNKAGRQVEAAATMLNEVEMVDFDLPVHVDETLLISMTVPFSETYSVPISATVPISMVVEFEDNVQVPINTIIPTATFHAKGKGSIRQNTARSAPTFLGPSRSLLDNA